MKSLQFQTDIVKKDFKFFCVVNKLLPTVSKTEKYTKRFL